MTGESYNLNVSPEGIRLEAFSEAGVCHGLTTLYQLADGKRIQASKTSDAPRYPHRGLSLDTGRHFVQTDLIKNILEQMSLAKMNVLHWRFSDDQGWRLESKRFPKLTEAYESNHEYYTQKDISDIVAYAQDRAIAVIPEIDLPGHTTALLSAYPEYSCQQKKVEIKQYGGIYQVVLCPGRESTYAMLEDLFDEICPL